MWLGVHAFLGVHEFAGRQMGAALRRTRSLQISDNSNEGEKMSRSTKKRGVLLGATLGIGATLSVVLGLGLMAAAGTAASTVAPVNTSPPTIKGTAQAGKTLAGDRGEWSKPVTDYNDFWMRCDADGGSCSNISGATDRKAYLLKPVDVGNTIRFKVQAKNGDGSTFAVSVPTAVVTAGAPPPPATGCPAGSGPIQVADLASPARLLIGSQRSDPTAITPATQRINVRYHVSACGGRPVQGALVYSTAVPFNQYTVPPEQTTDRDGFAELDFRQLSSFPLSPKQGLLVMFARARKPGENLLGGISTRRLFSIHVNQ